MNAEELRQIVEVLIKVQPQTSWSTGEIIGAVTATLTCIVATYIFIRSVINNGFDLIKLQNTIQNAILEKLEKSLEKMSETLMNYKLDTVKHSTCSERQENLIKRLGLEDMERRITEAEKKLEKITTTKV